MSRVRIILPYFGSLPSTWTLTLWTMARNAGVDWLILTDQPHSEAVAENIEIREMSFYELTRRIKSIFPEAETAIAPYKLTDYKPAYGLLFAEEFDGYDFWGYCDADVLFGDLMPELDQAFRLGVDRIFERGHLSLLRNVPQVVELFLKGRGRYSFSEVSRTSAPRAFDEVGGFYQIAVDHSLPTFEPFSLYDIFPDRYRPIADTDLRDARRFTYVLDRTRAYSSDPATQAVVSTGRYIHLQKRPLRLPAIPLVEAIERGDVLTVAPTELIVSPDAEAGARDAERSARRMANRVDWTGRYLRRRARNLKEKLTSVSSSAEDDLRLRLDQVQPEPIS